MWISAEKSIYILFLFLHTFYSSLIFRRASDVGRDAGVQRAGARRKEAY